MNLEKLLTQKRSAILDRWFKLILETYPADTKRFLKEQKDQFANPVGYTLSTEIENLFNDLLQGINRESASTILDRIIRIRAIQDFTPSQALSFIFLLKRAIREELDTEIRENRLFDEVLIFESTIDTLALLGFDIYTKCREKIYELRVNEAKNHVSGLLRKAGLLHEIPDWKPNLKEDGNIPYQNDKRF